MTPTRAERLKARLAERDQDPPEAPESREPPAQTPAKPRPAKEGRRTKYQAYVQAELKRQAEATVYRTNNLPGGYASLSELTEAALAKEIKRLQDELNGGEPFAEMPPGRKLPTRPPR